MVYSYQQAREYLEKFITHTLYQKITVASDNYNPLDRMRCLLRMLGNPHEKYPSIVVSGTSGKGSTTYLIAKILTEAGYKTGFASSPHLQKLTERMQINMDQVPENTFIDLINEVMPIIHSMETTPFGLPSYYEILLALTLLYFAKEQVDVAVVEVGLESKYDGTNILSPVAFVLTNISLDHTAILGNTIEEIANEATWRIKDFKIQNLDQVPVVITGVTQPSVFSMLKERVLESGVELFRLGTDFTEKLQTSSHDGSVFNFKNDITSFNNLHISLLGEYQVQNAALAIQTVLSLEKFGVKIKEETIRYTLTNSFFPGRFEEIVSNNTTIILDGAHNVAKMEAFLMSLEKIYPIEKKIFLVGFKKDKDITHLLSLIMPYASSLVITQFTTAVDLGKNLSMDAQEVALQIKDTKNVYIELHAKNAFIKALELAKKEGAIIVTTGSLYLVGEIREYLIPQISSKQKE